MAKCEPGSKIYTDCINALQSIEELGQLTLDDARATGNTSELAVGHGRQASGWQSANQWGEENEDDLIWFTIGRNF